MPAASDRACSRCGAPLPAEGRATACAACMLEASLFLGDESLPPEGDRHRVGDYELEEEIAHGAMGVVWRGRQVSLGRTVAVKLLLHGRYAAPGTVERFRREAQSAAALRHPHIVAVHEVGEEDGQHYIAMEHVAGSTLAQLLRGGPFPPRRAAEIARATAEAVAHAHERGVIHRDIKPSNLLLDPEGSPRLTDFGLAKPMDGSSDLTLSGQILGTPAYLPPEAAAGEEAGAAGDVYAIGAVLYEMLTGRPPFLAVSLPETLRLIRDAEPVAPRLLNRNVPRDLETIALKCLAKLPAQRLASADELAAELRRFLAGEPIRTRPVGPAERLVKWARRRRQLAALLLVTLLALLGGMTVLVLANVRIRAAQALTGQKAEENRRGLVRLNVSNGNRLAEEGDAFAALLRYAEALRLDAGAPAREEIHRRRFAATLRGTPRLARLLVNEAGVITARLSPDGALVAATLADGRVRLHALADGAGPVTRPPGDNFRHAWFAGAEGRQVACLDFAGRIRFFGVASGKESAPGIDTVFTQGAPPSYAAEAVGESPGGTHFVVPVAGGAQVFEGAGGRPLWPAPAAVEGFQRAEFSADGQRVIISGEAPAFQIRDVATGALLLAVPMAGENRIGALGLNRAGDQALVVTGARLHELSLWDVASGARRWTVEEPGRLIFTARFSASGAQVALATSRGHGRVLDAVTGARLSDTLAHRGTVWDCRFSPDGASVATFAMDQTARVWDARTGAPRSPLLRHPDVLFGGAFSRDGRYLLTQAKDPALRLWELKPRLSRLVLRPGGRTVRALFSPDGRTIATADGSNLRVWDAANGAPRVRCALPAEVSDLAFSPDGARLLAGGEDGSAHLCDARTGAVLAQCRGHTARIQAVEWSPDGRLFSTAGHDYQARLWNAADATPHSPPLWHGDVVRAARFSPDGRWLATASTDATVQVWNVADGSRALAPLRHASRVHDVRWSADGERLVGAELDGDIVSRAARVWDARTGRAVGPPLDHLDGVHTAAFSPDGRVIATAGEDNMASLWDATGHRLAPALRHDAQVRFMSFSPDGAMLLTCSVDATARVWDTATGEPITPPLPHDDILEGGMWHPSGSEVITCARDGTARVWEVAPARGSVASLTALAELLAALRLDPVAGQVPLTPGEIAARWQAVGTLEP